MKYNVKKDYIENLIENSNNDNANLGYNPEVISKYVHDNVMKQYSLNIMPVEVAEAHREGFIHVHDMEYYALRPNCFNFDLRFFIRNGLVIDGKGVDGSVASPARSLEVLLNHLLLILILSLRHYVVVGVIMILNNVFKVSYSIVICHWSQKEVNVYSQVLVLI